MICAYCLVYPDNAGALPQLWDWKQPCIHNIILKRADIPTRRGSPLFSRPERVGPRKCPGMGEALPLEPDVSPWNTWETWEAWLAARE